MKVKELIEELQKFDGEMTVVVDPYNDITHLIPGINNDLYENPESKLVLLCTDDAYIDTRASIMDDDDILYI